ncbi:HNH endonuclease [Rhodobacter sphaeroides]|jgi:HNH endonuclease.|uniref:Putative HNH nuclease YajD n=1 Tax=Cereibacter sphaeroides (strain ATCC 17023 / DSM 158 / JCM 6121 / CCUG 31486 / LMG 2827 / NBRC 12203 / NCIMB 8253 / ATH 2.4.1.) TaxID=272943 RepID=Q3J3W9_CERS4|nr:HNH endonuclease [Cereibacter sphaeroides]ABA78515.1 HNH nuclease / Probable phage PHI-105 holin-like protein [Cereibacter sphaeroides 2.4.1]AMJ46866.1 HNH endonuclease [Cereibacter sphaeroides]ANS33578.1 HNH endonuclease [Cereibacter sphaeroides]ATN62622.1 HNH endonuclease [Cereibacter sphaeroides]AXC60735.1 HNH endonuclease [Cereibacter sphaeroides 2.4.1]
MPRPPHLCTCGQLVPHGARCSCQIQRDRERKARFDQKRPSSRERGYTHEWRKARAEFLHQHPTCAFCGAPAGVVDHVIPHKGDMTLFWDRTNWQALCKPCHDRQKQMQERYNHIIS